MNVYKFTTLDMKSPSGINDGYRWEPFITRVIDPDKRNPRAELCTNAWLHAFVDPLVAMTLRAQYMSSCRTIPARTRQAIEDPVKWQRGFYARLWRAEAGGHVKHALGKLGCTELTLWEELQPVSYLTFAEKLYLGRQLADTANDQQRELDRIATWYHSAHAYDRSWIAKRLQARLMQLIMYRCPIDLVTKACDDVRREFPRLNFTEVKR